MTAKDFRQLVTEAKMREKNVEMRERSVSKLICSAGARRLYVYNSVMLIKYWHHHSVTDQIHAFWNLDAVILARGFN